jgi:hypothetical protein
VTPIAGAPEALSKEQLIAMAQGPLTKLFQDVLDRQIEVDRFYQVAIALRNELFWRGKQHIALSFSELDGSVSWDSTIPDTEADSNQQVLRYHFNITRSDGQKFVAVVGTRAPHAQVDPAVPEDAIMLRKARRASAAVRHLSRKWEADRKQKDIARTMWKTGPAFLLTRYVVDGDKYGYTEEPILGSEEVTVSEAGYVCPMCLSKQPEPVCGDCQNQLSEFNFQDAQTATVPKMMGTERYPKGGVECSVHNILEVVIQGGTKSLEESDYLRFERSHSRASIFSLYRKELGEDWLRADTADSLQSTETGASAAERARKQLTSPDAQYRGEPAGTSCRVIEDWLKSSYFLYLQDEPLREALTKQFPEGLHVVRVGDKIVDMLPGRACEEWAVAKTGTDEQIMSDALCHDLIPANEILNNFYNQALQTVVQSVPKTLVDATLFGKGVAERPIVGEIIPVKTTMGQDLNKQMAMLPTAKFSDQLMPLAAAIRADSREIDGVMEAIFGGGPTTQTWREAELRKNQALQQLGTAFDEMVSAWKKAYENGLRLLAKYGIDPFEVAPDKNTLGGQTETVDPQLIDMDGCVVTVNEAIPQSAVEERETLMFQLQNFPPEVVQALGLLHPASIPRVHQLLNLSGIYCPGENERAKVTEVIRTLLAEPPVQSFDPMSGMPALQPAIMPDPVLDDYGLVYELVKSWCNSEVGLSTAKENPMGFQHVRLYAEAQQQAMQNAQMQAAMAANPPAGPPASAGEPQQERKAA